jgi:hypothetical protein
MSNYFKLRIVLLGIFLTLTNCQKDDDFKTLEKQIENTSRFNVSKIGASKIKQNKKLTEKLRVLQEKISTNKTNIQNKTVFSYDYGFSINTNQVTYIESFDGNYHSYTFPVFRNQDTTLIENLVLSLKEDGNYKAVIATYDLSQQEKEDIKNNLFVDLSNKLTIIEIEDETLVDDIFSKATEDEIIVTVTTECCVNNTVGHDGGKEADGSNCPAHGYCTTTYYSSGGGVDSGYTHDNSNDTGSTTDSDGTSGGGGTTTGSNTNPDEDPTLDDNPCKGNTCTEIVTEPNVTVTATDFIVDNTDIKNLNPCPKDIYLELENLQQSGIKRVLNTFCSPNSVYDWQLKSEIPNNINPNIQAATNWELDINGDAIANSYITKIKPDFENTATRIAIARTILHESIHAYLLSQVDAADAGTINQTQFQNNFPLLWEHYMDGLGYADVAQHETIAQLFVNTLANALAEWDKNAQNPQYYRDLTWGGLDGTAIFQATTSLTDTDRRRIIGANLAEDTNLPQTYINGSGQLTTVSPNGIACP